MECFVTTRPARNTPMRETLGSARRIRIVAMAATRVLVIDSYDSFVFNLVQYLGELGAEPIVHRNDAITVDDAVALDPDGVRALTRARAAPSTPASSARRARRLPTGASRCSGCASATRRSATSTAPPSSARRR